MSREDKYVFVDIEFILVQTMEGKYLLYVRVKFQVDWFIGFEEFFFYSAETPTINNFQKKNGLKIWTHNVVFERRYKEMEKRRENQFFYL